MLHIIPAGSNINFLGSRRFWGMFSMAAIALSIAIFAIRGEKNFGIDFKGGDLLLLESKQPVTVAQVRGQLGAIGLADTSVIQSEKTVDKEFISIRCPIDTADKIEAHLNTSMPEAGFAEAKKDRVGKLVGGELAKSSLVALGLGILGILAYVTIRFEFSFAIGAIVAVIHDIVITLGVFALFGKEVSLIMVGAILTVAGYSINDTIVVYDRIREGLRAGRRGTIVEVMNACVNETLSRTLLTSGTTLLTVMALFLFGGPVLRDFALAVLIGIVVGTYSSIFIAAPIVLWWSGRGGKDLKAEVKRAQALEAQA
jgi:preprotein translocase SecF subunit